MKILFEKSKFYNLLIFYFEDTDGIKRESIHYLKNQTLLNLDGKVKKYENFSLSDDKLDFETNHYVLKYPLEVGTEWSVKDLTRVKYREGFDKVFQTWLPLIIIHEIVDTNETLFISAYSIAFSDTPYPSSYRSGI